MLTDYLEAAMRHARYEILKDDGTYYGEIPECSGVYANAATLEQCRQELAEVLEDWLLLRIHQSGRNFADRFVAEARRLSRNAAGSGR